MATRGAVTVLLPQDRPVNDRGLPLVRSENRVKGLVPPVNAHHERLVNATIAITDPTLAVAVPPIRRRPSKAVTEPEVDDLRDEATTHFNHLNFRNHLDDGVLVNDDGDGFESLRHGRFVESVAARLRLVLQPSGCVHGGDLSELRD